jgi:hypothetical protein
MMLQVIRRKRFSKLPLQANYYPLPTMAFIQDNKLRFTVVTAQPLGIGSLKEGQIEVSYSKKIALGRSLKSSHHNTFSLINPLMPSDNYAPCAVTSQFCLQRVFICFI